MFSKLPLPQKIAVLCAIIGPSGAIIAAAIQLIGSSQGPLNVTVDNKIILSEIKELLNKENLKAGENSEIKVRPFILPPEDKAYLIATIRAIVEITGYAVGTFVSSLNIDEKGDLVKNHDVIAEVRHRYNSFKIDSFIHAGYRKTENTDKKYNILIDRKVEMMYFDWATKKEIKISYGKPMVLTIEGPFSIFSFNKVINKSGFKIENCERQVGNIIAVTLSFKFDKNKPPAIFTESGRILGKCRKSKKIMIS